MSDDLTQGIQGGVGKIAMPVKTCWFETDRCFGWEGETSLANYHQLVNRDCWPTHELLRRVFTQGTYTVYFFDETDGVFASPLTFPLVSVQFRCTLRVCREVSS